MVSSPGAGLLPDCHDKSSFLCPTAERYGKKYPPGREEDSGSWREGNNGLWAFTIPRPTAVSPTAPLTGSAMIKCI